MFNEQDYQFMAQALKLAEKPVFSPHPNPRVGCVIVKNKVIVGEGFHEVAGQAHAEINALKLAGESAKNATVYVTLEPCSHFGRTPPCADALIKADVSKVIVAMRDPNPKVSGEGIRRLKEAGIEVQDGLLEAQAKTLNRGFIKRMTKGLPWVRTKIAMSVDGKTAMANGESQWITGEHARRDVQQLRACSDAILTGVGTVLSDNPRMTVRGIEGLGERQPLRVIVDSRLTTPEDAQIFSQQGHNLIATSYKDKTRKYPERVEIQTFDNIDNGVDLSALLNSLAEREINEVHVEAGSKLNGSLLSLGLVDEIIIYLAPILMGSSARGIFELPEIKNMKDKINLQHVSNRMVGQDIRMDFLCREQPCLPE